MRPHLTNGAADLTAEPERTLCLRPAVEADLPFVLETWLRSYQTSRFALHRGHRYMADQREIANWCMAHGGVMVAHDASEPGVILGWACGSHKERLDYVYVKHLARRLGVASGLLSALDLPKGGRVTHARNSRNKADIVRRGWRFEPVTREEMANGPK